MQLSSLSMGVTRRRHRPTFERVMLEGDNYALRATGLTGVSDSYYGSMSFWFKPTFDDTVDHVIFRAASSRVTVTVDAAKRLRVHISSGSSSFTFRTVSAITPATVESHYAIAWDTNQAAGEKVGVILRDGVSDCEIFADIYTPFMGIYTTQPSIGASAAGALTCTGELRELLYWPGVQIDWATKLSTVFSAGAAVDPGATGAAVTGTAPAVYLSLRGEEGADAFLANRGTGGDFVQATGTPTIRADTPLIPYGDSLVFGTSSSSYPTKTWVYLTTRGVSPAIRRFNYGVGGETATAIRTRFVAAVAGHVAEYPKAIYILEGGYNSIGGEVSAILSNVQQMVDALLAQAPQAKFIFMGIPNCGAAGQESGGATYLKIVEANAGISAIVGASRFLDIRTWLIANGLTAAGLTPTVDDLADIAADIVPRQLRPASTDIHWNDFGQVAVAAAVVERLQTLGWD